MLMQVPYRRPGPGASDQEHRRGDDGRRSDGQCAHADGVERISRSIADSHESAERGKLSASTDLLGALFGAASRYLGGYALDAIGVGALAIGANGHRRRAGVPDRSHRVPAAGTGTCMSMGALRTVVLIAACGLLVFSARSTNDARAEAPPVGTNRAPT